MIIVSYELTMPNRGSWNGRWSGETDKFYVIKKYSDRFFNKNENFATLKEKKSDSWHYSWNDGWGANVRAEIIDSTESRKRKKISKGFCSYNWMIDSIENIGEIKNSTERAKEKRIK